MRVTEGSFRRIGEEQGWWNADALVVAVSGGSDSMALLWLLKRFFRGRLVVAHLEHGIRGEESLEDARFVKSLAQLWGLECVIRHEPVPSLKEKGEGLEEAARRVRYRFLEEVRTQTQADWVALGHTADDQAETVLFNLLRGSGIRGLSGIPERRGPFVRPVIRYRREELRTLLEANGLAWREDRTNEDLRYSRNFLRKRILPELATSFNPRVVEHLVGIAEEAAALKAGVDRKAEALCFGLRRPFPGTLRAWDRKLAKRLTRNDLAETLRFEARTLGLPALSRHRTELLVSLIEAKSDWCFQWKEDYEVHGKGALLFWQRRERLAGEEGELDIDLEASPSGSAQWGFWKVSWVSKEPIDPLSFKTKKGQYGARIPAFSDRVLQILPLYTSSLWSRGVALSSELAKHWPVFTPGREVFWTPMLTRKEEFLREDSHEGRVMMVDVFGFPTKT